MATPSLIDAQLASPLNAAVLMFVSTEKYSDLSTRHVFALCLKAPDLRAMFDKGRFPDPGWWEETRAKQAQYGSELRRSFFRSFVLTAMFVAAGLLVSLLLGKVAPDRPPDWGKVLSLVGAGLAGWATLFELGGYVETNDGESLHELVRPVLFRAVFLPGLALAALGQLW